MSTRMQGGADSIPVTAMCDAIHMTFPASDIQRFMQNFTTVFDGYAAKGEVKREALFRHKARILDRLDVKPPEAVSPPAEPTTAPVEPPSAPEFNEAELAALFEDSDLNTPRPTAASSTNLEDVLLADDGPLHFAIREAMKVRGGHFIRGCTVNGQEIVVILTRTVPCVSDPTKFHSFGAAVNGSKIKASPLRVERASGRGLVVSKDLDTGGTIFAYALHFEPRMHVRFWLHDGITGKDADHYSRRVLEGTFSDIPPLGWTK